MGFPRQECWSGLPFLSPGDLPNPGIESRSPALQADSLQSELPQPHGRVTWGKVNRLPEEAKVPCTLASYLLVLPVKDYEAVIRVEMKQAVYG